MRFVTRNTLRIIIATMVLGTTGPARVHPHVFAEARLDIDLDTRRNVTALKHVWRFDELFSSTVLVEFDGNADLKLDDSELKQVSDTVYEFLSEFGYFQFVTADGKDIAMHKPERLIAAFEDGRLLILFKSEPREPLPLAGRIAFGVYDPTFYTAIDFLDDEHMAVGDMPAECQRSVIRPDPDEAIAQNQASLTDEFFNDPAGTDLSKIFATRLELNCPN